jgi:two-component system CheB/CheR fusion protein
MDGTNLAGAARHADTHASSPEAAAFARIAQAMARRPEAAYQVIVDAVLELTSANSSGISLIDDETQRLYWPAVAGFAKEQISGSASPEEIPCGQALASGETVLLERPGERYPRIALLQPTVNQALCIPVRVEGAPAATLWALRQGTAGCRLSDRDRALIETLSDFLAAHQMHARALAARETAEKSQRTLQTLMEHIPEGIAIATAPDVTITHVSRYGQQMTAKQSRELQGIPAERHPQAWQIHDEAGELVAADRLPLTRAARMGEVIRNEQLLLRDAQGAAHTILCNAGPIRDERGEITGALIAWRDIDEMLRVQRALRESEGKFRALAELLPAKLFVTDAAGYNVYVNSRLYEFTGAPPGSLQGEGWTRYVHPDDLPKVRAAWSRAVETGEPYEVEYRFRNALSGEYRWFLVRSNPGRNDRGDIAAWYGAAIDIDEARRARAALREANRAKDVFLSTLAHELRNPLAPIRNAARILQSSAVDAGSATWCREVISRQVAIMARLLDDLLDLSRIARGKLELRLEPVLVWTIIGTAIETSRPLIETRRHELSVRMPQEPIRIDADAVRITQVVANLLNNAAKYTPEGGRIELAAAIEDGALVVTVADNGIGLSAEDRERIFEMFTQVNDARGEGPGGLGIGLALVRTIAQLHGGHVEASSPGPGHGSTFKLLLPLTPCAAVPKEDVEQLATGSSRPRVLVVDDNRDVADSLAMMLSLDGYEVQAAYSGQDALAMACESPVDVALVDIGMPGMDGYALARAWRNLNQTPQPFLVAVTGWGTEEDRSKAARAGFDRHMTKPVDPTRFTALLASEEWRRV